MRPRPTNPARRWTRRAAAGRLLAAAVVAAGAAARASAAAVPAPPDADDPFSRTVESGGVAVRTTIRATSYRWTITNRTGAPVREISVPVRHTAGIVPPDGWSYVLEDDRIVMTADRAGLGTGRSLNLVAQTPFDLARVTTGTISLRRIGDELVTVEDAWVPGPKRPAAWWTMAGGVVAIAFVHLAIVEVRSRRRRRGEASGD